MKAPPFASCEAASLADVSRLQADAGSSAVLLAGGQTLLASLAFRLSSPDLLIDITGVPELQGVAPTSDADVRRGIAYDLALPFFPPPRWGRAPRLRVGARGVINPKRTRANS